MFTLKIHWWREEECQVAQPSPDVVADERTLFIEAAEVRAHGRVLDPETEMSHWTEHHPSMADHGYHNHQALSSKGRYQARLIETRSADGISSWYLASRAWLLGHNGQTIERLM